MDILRPEKRRTEFCVTSVAEQGQVDLFLETSAFSP